MNRLSRLKEQAEADWSDLDDGLIVVVLKQQTILDLIETVESLTSVEPVGECNSQEGLDDGRFCVFCGQWQDKMVPDYKYEDSIFQWVTEFEHESDCPWLLAQKWREESE